MKKKLLLFTSILVGDTGKVSFSYIFQNKETDAFDKYPEQCSGAFGVLKETDTEGTYYMNVFEGGKGLLFAAPIVDGDTERNKKLVDECFPKAFNLLCTKEVADAIIPLISEWVDVEVIFSEETLLTAK